MTIFITGTDTDIGKTVVTAGIAAVMQGLGYKTAVYKPVQSGCVVTEETRIAPDLHFVKSIDPNIITKSTYNLIEPAAPSLAAGLEGIKINVNTFVRDYQELRRECDIVLVEGAGGFMVPICEKFLMRDMAKLLNIPVLIVARPDLGTINHTLLTIEAARSRNIDILGVIISNYPTDTDDIVIKAAPKMITKLSGIKVLGLLPKIQSLTENLNNSEILIDAVIKNIDLQEVFRIKIPKLV